MTLSPGDKTIAVPDGKGGYYFVQSTAPVVGDKGIMIGGKFIRATAPVEGDKTFLFPHKVDGNLIIRPDPCPNFNMINIGITPPEPLLFTVTSYLAVYDNCAYVVGNYGGNFGFAKFNGTGFDFTGSPYGIELTETTIDISEEGVIWIMGFYGDDCHTFKYDTGVWSNYPVKSFPTYSHQYSPNLKLDNFGKPNVLVRYWYQESYAVKTSLFVFNGSTYDEEIIEVVNGSVGNDPSSLKFDSDNYPHITKTTDFAGAVYKYFYKDGTGWHLEYPLAKVMDMCIDQDDVVHTVCRTIGGASYCWRDGDGWHEEAITFEGFVSEAMRISCANDGTIHISNYHWLNGAEWIFKKLGGSWKICHVHDVEGVAEYYTENSNIAVGTDNKPHFVFWRSTWGFYYTKRQ